MTRHTDLRSEMCGVRRPRGVAAGSVEPFVWTHLSRPGGGSGIERAGVCTPYTAELIVDDALRAGRGAVLEVVVAAEDSEDAALAHVQTYFAHIPERGVTIDVRRGVPAGREAARSRAEERAA